MAASAAEIGGALAVPVDVSDPASVDALAGRVLETFGAGHGARIRCPWVPRGH
jgi:NAD(P)-dependent dehydrogenase (short-subunit alcohol dehydrogenase family)